MKIEYSELANVYPIKLKFFEPESRINGSILAVHGFCGDMESSVITTLAERMTDHGIAVVTFNFPGHGTSTADEYFNLANCRADMCEVLEYTQKNYPDMIGVFATSFGGYVTLLSLDGIQYRTKIILRAPAVNMAKSFEKFVPDMEQFRSSKMVELGFERKLNVSYDFYNELCNNDVFSVSIDRPMLVICGDCDDVVNAEDIQRFCKQNPQTNLEIIKGAEHRFKNPRELKKAIDISEKYFVEG